VSTILSRARPTIYVYTYINIHFDLIPHDLSRAIIKEFTSVARWVRFCFRFFWRSRKSAYICCVFLFPLDIPHEYFSFIFAGILARFPDTCNSFDDRLSKPIVLRSSTFMTKVSTFERFSNFSNFANLLLNFVQLIKRDLILYYMRMT